MTKSSEKIRRSQLAPLKTDNNGQFDKTSVKYRAGTEIHQSPTKTFRWLIKSYFNSSYYNAHEFKNDSNVHFEMNFYTVCKSAKNFMFIDVDSKTFKTFLLNILY